MFFAIGGEGFSKNKGQRELHLMTLENPTTLSSNGQYQKIVAFANASSGKIVFEGEDDTLRVTGIPQDDVFIMD
ncbi:ATP-binding protein [Frisingicoccus caecimuris]|nr:ATP-binding protein [Frisingicoccus caecimuris]